MPFPFLNPLLLFGMTSVSIPIIIHLLNKRKFEHVVWAAMRFLQAAIQQNQRRILIEDLLLLALRCLLLIVLSLALARMACSSSAASSVFGEARVTAVFILDNSYSMSCTDGVRSRFAQAKDAATQIVDTLPPGSSAALILASDIADAVISEPTHDMNLVRRALAEARLSDRKSDLSPAIAKGLETLKGRPTMRKEVYLFTDGQRIAWDRLNEIKEAFTQARDVKSHIIFVGSKEDQNLGVTGLRLASGMAAVNHPLRYEATVTNFGSEAVQDVRVSVKVDNDPPADDSMIDSIGPGASKTVSLFAKLRGDGFHTVTASIPTDHLPADDERTIAVRGVTEVRVLLVAGTSGHTAREGSTYFLKNTLLPVPPAEQDQYWIKVTTITPGELDMQKLDGFDCVMLADVADFTTSSLDNLASYLARGGGLVVFPGSNTQANFYNDQLLNTYHFLPASLGPARGQADKDDKFFSMQDKNFEHPISSIWADAASGTPAAAHFYRAFQLIPATDLKTTASGDKHEGQTPMPEEPAAEKGGGYLSRAGIPRVVLRFGKGTGDNSLDNQPAVMERAWGLGRVILFASTADTRWTDLPAHPGIFVPLMYRCLGSIVQRQDEGLNVKVGERFVFHPQLSLLDKYVLINKPPRHLISDDKSTQAPALAPDSRKVELSKEEDAPLLTYDTTDLAGGYEVKLPDNLPPIRFAAQSDPIESSLEEVTPEQLAVLGQVSDVIKWTSGMPLAEKIAKQRSGTELWFQLAVLALVLALAETVLAEWFSRTK